MGVKVRRTIEIRKFFGIKRMGNQPVDATDHQMIRDPLHHFQSLVPAIRPKCLTHGTSLFFGVKVRRRRRQLSKGVVIKFAIAATCIEGIMMVIHPRHNLAANHVNPCKIHSLLATEIVSRSIAQSGMRSVVLDGVA